MPFFVSNVAERAGCGSTTLRSFSDACLEHEGRFILPPVFASEFEHLDSPVLRPQPPGADSSFRFHEEDHTRFFAVQMLAPDTEAFCRSLRAPLPNLLNSKEHRSRDSAWRFVATASSYAARLAAFSTALVDLLIRADDMEVTVVDRDAIRATLIDLNALSFSQATRLKLHATSERRHQVLDSLDLPKEYNESAVTRIPRSEHEQESERRRLIDSESRVNPRLSVFAAEDRHFLAEEGRVPVPRDAPVTRSHAAGGSLERHSLARSSPKTHQMSIW